jgi:hypothetical protein
LEIPGLNLNSESEDLFPSDEQDQRKVVAWAQQAFKDAEVGRQELEDRWLGWYKMYRSWSGKRPKGDWRSRTWMPVSFYVIETIIPRLVAQLPKLTVLPVGPEDEPGATQMETLLEWATDQSDLYLELVKAFKSALMYGTGIIKTMYDERSVWDIRQEQVMEPMMMEMALPEMDVDGNPLVQSIPVGERPTGEVKTIREKVVRYAGPAAEAVDIADFFPSPEATSVEDASYVVHRVFRTKDYLEDKAEKGVYKLPDRDTWEQFVDAYDHTAAMRLAEINLGPGSNSTSMAGQKLIEIWEFWTDEYVCTVAGKSVLIRAEKNPFAHGEKPFVRVLDHLVPFEFWGIGELEPLEGVQDTLNALWNSRIDNVKLVLNTMFAVSTDYLQDPSDLNVRPGGVIRVREGVPIDQVVKPIDLGEVTQSSYTEAAEMERLSEKVSGVSAYQMGTDSPALNRTATGVALISEQGNTRFAHKNRISELTGLRRLGRHFGSILQQFMPAQMILRIIGPEGSFEWQTVTADSVGGAFDYNVEAESAAQTESIRREQTLSLFQMLVGMPEINTRRLIEDVLKTFGRKDIQNYLLDPMTMMMQQMAAQGMLPEQQQMMMMAQGPGPEQVPPGAEPAPAPSQGGP